MNTLAQSQRGSLRGWFQLKLLVVAPSNIWIIPKVIIYNIIEQVFVCVCVCVSDQLLEKINATGNASVDPGKGKGLV